MNELQQVLNEIKTDKIENLKPENLREGISLLGVNGTAEIPEPIYKTTNFSENKTISTGSYGGATFFKDYTFVWYSFSDSKTSGTLDIYNKNELEYSNVHRDFVSNVNVSNGKIIILYPEIIDNKIYCGMPYNTTSFGDKTLTVFTYDTVGKNIQKLDNIELSFPIYYGGTSESSNYSFSQLYYDKYLLLYTADRSPNATYLCNYNINDNSVTLIYPQPVLTSQATMCAPNYIVDVSSTKYGNLYYLNILDNEVTLVNIQSEIGTIYGVTYDGSGIFINGKLYKLINNNIGELIQDNCFELSDTYYCIKAINDKYYVYGTDLYTLSESNKLELAQHNIYFSGNTLVSTESYEQITTFNFNSSNELIGIYYNNTYLFPNKYALYANYILYGYKAYKNDGTEIQGTMPNNGDVTITPTLEEQTKEQGYYNSLTIEPVTSEIDTNIKPENIKKRSNYIRSYRYI